MRRPTIVAMGGGGFLEEPDNTLLDDYVLSLTGKARPRVCFIPTASGDSADFVQRFRSAFPAQRAEASVLELFNRTVVDLEAFVLGHDVIYVGGGNTANMLAVWRVHGMDRILRKAWEQGVVLCGLSAGGLCWFEEGVTDSFSPQVLSPLHDGLGLLSGSFCPHYDGDVLRRPAFERLVQSQELHGGWAADNGVGLHFEGTQFRGAVASRPEAMAWRLDASSVGPELAVHPEIPRLLGATPLHFSDPPAVNVVKQRERPSFIISSSVVAEEPGQYPGTTEILSHGRPIGAAAGLQRLGLHIERLPAGNRTSLPHAHEDEEEFVYVVEGEVDAWIDGALHPMVAGDVAAFPAGTGTAHTILNNTSCEAVLLVGGERSMGKSRIVYPLNPERKERMTAGRWWGDAPGRRIGAWPAHATPGSEDVAVLETERLALRWWSLDDAEAMYRVFGDPAVHRYSGAEPYQNVAAARAWLEREVATAPARGFGHWAVVEKATQQVVGSCGFRSGFEAGELEMGFTIAASHWGRRYATEIAAACVRFGTERLRATKVLALTMPENAAARRVLEKAGLALWGTQLHDGTSWCVYESVRTDTRDRSES